MAQKILVLDDEESYAQMLTDILKEHSYQVDMVTNAQIALEMLEDKEYKLVVSDFKMPVLDGADLLSQIRKNNPFLPVIMVSGLMNLPELIKVANMSITLVLEKPIDIQAFLSAVAQYVDKSSEKELAEAEDASVGKDTLMLMDGWVFNYPGTSYYSEKSFASKVFLQKLWDSVRYGNSLFLIAPPGSELDLVCLEIGHWKKQNAGEVVHIPVNELKETLTPRYIEQHLEDKNKSIVLCIHGFDQLSATAAAEVLKLISKDMNAIAGGSSIYFLYAIESSVWEEKAPFTQELMQFAKERMIFMPPMKERLTDLAITLKKMLVKACQSFNTPAREALPSSFLYPILSYSWPGNYEEIKAMVHSWTESGKNKPLELRDLYEAIPAMKEIKDQETSLKDYLTKKQTLPIKKAYDAFNGRWRDVFFALDLKKDSLPSSETKPEDLPLVYPEIIFHE